MDKGKLLPILLIVFLVACAIGIFSLNSKKNKVQYSKLVVNYQGKEMVYDNLDVDYHFNLENVDFYITGIEKDLLIFNTNSYVTVNLKRTSEFQIDVNEFANVCFNKNNCAEFRLAWGRLW